MKENPTILFVGIGAVGASVGAWVASNYENTYFMDLKEVTDILEKDGITHYPGENKSKPENTSVKVIRDLTDIPTPDVVVIAVKNYSLDAVSKQIKEKLGDAPIIIGMQNGIENQTILPKYFSKVIYGIVCYNAWLDKPGVVGYQKKGPLVLGTVNNERQFEMDTIRDIFNKGVQTMVTLNLNDAVHSKMIINLTNSLTTLIGHHYNKITHESLFQKLLTNLTYEGVQIVKAAGYEECKLGNMPPWLLMQAGVTLPRFITKIPFKMNLKKMVVSSMAQDILQRGTSQSELESLNGYFVRLAEKHNIDAPYNQTIYELCKSEFCKPEFKPWRIKEVWAKVKANLK